MTATIDYLENLTKKGIEFQVQGENIHCRSIGGELTPDAMQFLKERKREIVEYLRLNETEKGAYTAWYQVALETFYLPPERAHVNAMQRINFSRRVQRGEFESDEARFDAAVREFGGVIQ